mgnify:CR=1 FL=1
MNKDLILQILIKAHFMIPRDTYLSIYPKISPAKTTLENLEMIAVTLHEDLVLKDNILLALTDVNASLTSDKQVTKEEVEDIIEALDLPPKKPTGDIESQNATK